MSDVVKILTSVLLFVSVGLFAQQKESDRLKKEQEELKKKIGLTQNLLESTKSNKESLTQNITLTERKIEYRSDLLNNLNKQIAQLGIEIEQLNLEIESLQNQIEQQKLAYKVMLVYAYKMRSSTSSLIFILSSESFNQASKRMAYQISLVFV